MKPDDFVGPDFLHSVDRRADRQTDGQTGGMMNGRTDVSMKFVSTNTYSKTPQKNRSLSLHTSFQWQFLVTRRTKTSLI